MSGAELNTFPELEEDHPAGVRNSDPAFEERSKIWDRIQTRIKQRLGVERFGIWFKKTELMEFSDSTLVVGVPNVIIKQYLEQKYRDSVAGIVKSLTGRQYAVRFDVAPHLLRKSRSIKSSDRAAGPEGGEEAAAHGSSPHAVEGKEKIAESFWGRRHSFERLIVTDANRLPFLAAQEIGCRENPRFDFLMILGRPGYGKTALLEAIASGAKSSGIAGKAVCEMAETWCNDYYHALRKKSTRSFRNHYRSCDIFLLDGIQFLQGKPAAQDELLFTAKALHARGARVVLSSSQHPNELLEVKPEIHNLLKGAFWAELVMPPENERIQMARQFADLHMVSVTSEVCTYMGREFAGSMQELNAAIGTVAAYAGLHSLPRVDLSVAGQALSASVRTCPRVITMEEICREVAAASALTVDSLRGGSRCRNICRARQLAVMLAREFTELSLSDIGRYLGGRSHSTVKHSLSMAEKLGKGSAAFADMLARVRKQLEK